MGAVAVALAVGVVLVDDDVLALRQHLEGGLHRPGQDPLPRLVETHALTRVGTLRRREFGMGMVDVVPSAVGQHGVHQMRLDLGRHGALTGEAARIATGRLVLEVPLDLALLLGDVGVDQERRGGDRVGLPDAAKHDPVLRLDPADLANRHTPGTLAPVGA